MDERPAWRKALDFVCTHRRKIVGGVIVALPIIARYVPGFPTDEVMSVLRAFLGA